MKVISYQRVSTQAQDLHRQQTLAEEYCKTNGHELVQVFKEKISGANTTNRKALDALLQCTKDDADMVIVSELSRITRNEKVYYKILNIIEILKENGLDIVFLDEPDTIYRHSEDFSLAQLITLIVKAQGAAEEKAKIKERMTTGKRDKALLNPYMLFGGKAPFGFKAVANPKFEKGKKSTDCQTIIAINEEQANAIKLIYDMAISGKSAMTIAETIKASGILNSDGKALTAPTITQILHNSLYKGERDMLGAKVKITPIVSANVWEQAQKAISTKRCMITKVEARYNPLKGLLFCGDCGLPMGVFKRSKGLNYKCYFSVYKNGKQHITEGKECHNTMVSYDNLNNAIWKACKEYIKTDEYYGASNLTYAEHRQHEQQLIKAFGDFVEKRKEIIAKVEKFTNTLANTDDADMVELLQTKINALAKEKEETEKAMNDNQQALNRTAKKMAEIAKNLPNKDMTIQEKSEFYHSIIERIEWHSKTWAKVGTIVIKYKNGSAQSVEVATRA